MPRRGEAASEFGRASFEKEFGATNAGFSRGMGDLISPSPLQVLSKTLPYLGNTDASASRGIWFVGGNRVRRSAEKKIAKPCQ